VHARVALSTGSTICVVHSKTFKKTQVLTFLILLVKTHYKHIKDLFNFVVLMVTIVAVMSEVYPVEFVL
jgi:hypothetical protein